MFSISVPSCRPLRLVPMLALVAACGGSSSTASGVQPTAQPTVVTETFSGLIGRNGAYTHPFSVSDSGLVSVFLTLSADARNPDRTVQLGVSLGTWNGTSCAVVIANDSVAAGSSITGQATAAGNLCVRVYDVGFIASAATYELLIDHY